MGKAAPDAVLDTLLDEIATADTMYACTDEPANFAGISSVALADVTLTPGDGNGDFTIDDGDASGRKLTVAQQTGIEIDTTGTADHIVLADASNSELLFVTTCSSQSLTDGNTLTIGSWDIEIGDPT